MAIRCEHIHRLDLRKSFKIFGRCGNVASVPKAPVIPGFLILGEKTLKPSQKLFKFYYHISHDMEICR